MSDHPRRDLLPPGWTPHPRRPSPNLYKNVTLNACWTEGYSQGWMGAIDTTNSYAAVDMRDAYRSGYRCGYRDRYGRPKGAGQGETRPGKKGPSP